VRLNYPDSASPTTNQSVILFPTIETSKGANFAFYYPQTINLTVVDGDDRFDGLESNLSSILFPDGDGYETVTVKSGLDSEYDNWEFSDGGTLTNLTLNTTGNDAVPISIGRLKFNITNAALANSEGVSAGLQIANQSGLATIWLHQPGGSIIKGPALIIWEEKDDNSEYDVVVVALENGLTADDGIGVDDLYDTWSNGSATWEATLKSNDKLTKSLDLWGTIMTEDTSDSDQKVATVSYPDEQVYADLYIAAADATVTAGGVNGASSAQLGDVLVMDSEMSSVSTKNLVVIGGSCINSAASKLLGGAGCGSSWMTATGVGSGQFLIQSFAGETEGKIALLVAGYDVSDTANAGKYLRTQAVKTDKGTKYIGTTSTSATLQTEETAVTTEDNSTA